MNNNENNFNQAPSPQQPAAPMPAPQPNYTQPINSEPPNTSFATPKPKGSGTKLILIGIIAVLAVAGLIFGAIILFGNKSDNNSNTSGNENNQNSNKNQQDISSIKQSKFETLFGENRASLTPPQSFCIHYNYCVNPNHNERVVVSTIKWDHNTIEYRYIFDENNIAKIEVLKGDKIESLYTSEKVEGIDIYSYNGTKYIKFDTPDVGSFTMSIELEKITNKQTLEVFKTIEVGKNANTNNISTGGFITTDKKYLVETIGNITFNLGSVSLGQWYLNRDMSGDNSYIIEYSPAEMRQQIIQVWHRKTLKNVKEKLDAENKLFANISSYSLLETEIEGIKFHYVKYDDLKKNTTVYQYSVYTEIDGRLFEFRGKNDGKYSTETDLYAGIRDRLINKIIFK